jgi:uncharacterized protein (TIGR01244 family)
MPNIIQLDDCVLVSGQIHPGDMAEIAAAGIAAIVNNRPDGEAPESQPSAAAIADAARSHGLAFRDIPFSGANLTPGQVAAFAALLRASQGPILAYCRSGSRSSLIWAAARVANGADIDEVLQQAQAVGIDLAGARRLIEALGHAAADEAGSAPGTAG